MFKHTQRWDRSVPLPLFACTDLVTASLCSSSFQTIQGAVCVLLEGPGISCWDVHSQLLLLGVGWGWQMDNTLANVKWKCYANGVGDKAPTHLRKGVGFRLKVKRSHFHSQPAADFSRLFPGLRCLRKSPGYGWAALPACWHSLQRGEPPHVPRHGRFVCSTLGSSQPRGPWPHLSPFTCLPPVTEWFPQGSSTAPTRRALAVCLAIQEAIQIQPGSHKHTFMSFLQEKSSPFFQ